MLSNTNSNYSHYEFSDIVEKLTECEIGKSFSWVKKWLVVQGNNFLFFSKRLGTIKCFS